MAKRRRRSGRAQLKVRLPEPLRREIEAAAAQRGHSMNTEIVERLLVFDKTRDAKKLVAQALLDTLDDEVIGYIVAEAAGRKTPDLLDLPLTPRAPRPQPTEAAKVLNMVDELRKMIAKDMGEEIPDYLASAGPSGRQLTDEDKSGIGAAWRKKAAK